MTSAITVSGRNWHAWSHALVSGVSVVAAGGLGGMATGPNIPTWYAGLTKPWFAPPDWLFGPAWTLLYVLMAYAFFRVLRAAGSRARTLAIYAFAVQIVLNALWPFAFFAARSPLLGLAVIGPLWIMIAVTIWLFARVDRPAAGLLLPYIAWVTYASALNAGYLLLN